MSEYEGRRILVTGGAGFIGSHLVDALIGAGAVHVAVVDDFFLGRDENLEQARRGGGGAVTVYRDDAGDPGAMAAVVDAEQPDIVFDLATRALEYSFFNPAGAFTVNVDVALTLAELLRAGRYRRLVHVSSSEVYGTAVRVPMDEDHPLLAETTYAAGKAAADLVLTSYARMFALDVVIARPFNTYGPRQNEEALAALIPLTLRRLRQGEPPVIHGDGRQTRDFTYVADIVAALSRLAVREEARGGTFNLASGRESSVKEIVDSLCRAAGYAGEIRFADPRPADVARQCADVSRAAELIGSVASTDLDDGLARTAAWYLEEVR